MSIAVTPSPASKVRATRHLDPAASLEEIARRTGVELGVVKSILGRESQHKPKSVAR